MNKTLLATAVLTACFATACAAKNDTAATTAAVDPAPMTEPAPMTDAPAAEPAASATGMSADRDIVDNAAASPDFSTLVAAVTAAGLVDTLKGAGPFTVFAPTNAAFSALPAGTVDTLLKPESKADLTKILTYHVVAGKVDAATLVGLITAGGGTAVVTTVEGGTLTASAANGGVTLTDAKGNVANVTTTDLNQSNGVIHVVDKVLMP